MRLVGLEKNFPLWAYMGLEGLKKKLRWRIYRYLVELENKIFDSKPIGGFRRRYNRNWSHITCSVLYPVNEVEDCWSFWCSPLTCILYRRLRKNEVSDLEKLILWKMDFEKIPKIWNLEKLSGVLGHKKITGIVGLENFCGKYRTCGRISGGQKRPSVSDYNKFQRFQAWNNS